MPITTAVVALNAVTPTLLATGSSLADKVTIIAKAASAAVYLGGSAVTSATGLLMNTTDAIALDLGPGDLLYAIASSGTPTINTLVTRQ